MITAISESRIFQKIGLDMNRDADLAPKPIEVNQRKLAKIAPITKNHLSEPN
jgi:hypothetical protein